MEYLAQPRVLSASGCFLQTAFGFCAVAFIDKRNCTKSERCLKEAARSTEDAWLGQVFHALFINAISSLNLSSIGGGIFATTLTTPSVTSCLKDQLLRVFRARSIASSSSSTSDMGWLEVHGVHCAINSSSVSTTFLEGFISATTS